MQGPRIKTYPHFDAPLLKIDAERLVSDPDRVVRHPFYPFLEWELKWSKFAKKDAQSKDKTRKIRYAARRDSYIFSHYREELYLRYESELNRLELGECVIAYRRIPVGKGSSGKCNIHFAGEAFEIIRRFGNCCAIALDIEEFFENLDHRHLKRRWSRLLAPLGMGEKTSLPKDQFAVFRAITHYSWIERDVAYEALGLVERVKTKNGKERVRHLLSKRDFPIQICKPPEFHEKLAAHIETNRKPFGIPQGSPISDLLANIYMIDFDSALKRFIESIGGKYFRYSDDILILLPDPDTDCARIIDHVKSTLERAAPRLRIKDKKTRAHSYRRIQNGPDQIASNVWPLTGADGIEYLGFRYDGKKIFLRDSTVSGFIRKITHVSERMARNHVIHHPNLALKGLVESFNYDVLFKKFGRVTGFEFAGSEYTEWTFWTYVERSVRILGPLSKPILGQVKSYKALARRRVFRAIQDALNRRQIP